MVKAYLSRVLAAVVAGIGAWIATKLGAVWAPTAEEQAALVTTLVPALVTVGTLVYGVVHRWIDGFINPGDEAKPQQ